MTNCGSEGWRGLIFPVCPLLLILQLLRIIHRALKRKQAQPQTQHTLYKPDSRGGGGVAQPGYNPWLTLP